MKKHVLSLFNPEHRWWTIIYFIAAFVLIIASRMVGITDNLPGIALLLGGMICFFLVFFHVWREPKSYAILAAISFGLIVLTFLMIYLLDALGKDEYISEGVVMSFIGLICIPGILVGLGGSVFWSLKGK